MKTKRYTKKSADSLPAAPRGTNSTARNGSKPSASAQPLDSWKFTPEPWPDAVEGAELLDTLRATFVRYLVLPDHAAATLALWIVHTYAYQLGRVAVYAALLSPEKRCGKTTALSVLAELAHRALPASNVTPSVVFRVIELFSPTLLIDEADSFMSENEELRGILNAGFTRGSAFVLRNVGENHEPKKFIVFGPKLFAGIGKLPGTLADRSIIIPMRRKQRCDVVERFRGFDGEELRRKCARWVKDNEAQLADADPFVPDALNDRAADLWRPLLAIANLAGNEWSDVARRAAVGLSADGEDDSQAVKLLADTQAYFHENLLTRTLTKDLLTHLNGLEEQPWATFNHGNGMNSRQLADKLKAFGVHSRTMRDGDNRAKGYMKEDFADAFTRYLPPASVTA